MFDVEYTDTFGGDANYSWVKRATIEAPTYPIENRTGRTLRAYRATIMRRAKAAMGLSGLRGRTSDLGDGFEFRPYGICAVMFVTWADR